MSQELRAFASTSPVGGEKCPVCLRRLRKSRLGKPENCDHYFCFTCIHEWAKNVNTCPVDRIQFNNIEVYSHIRGKLLDKVYIQNSNVIESVTDPNDVTYCEICHQCDREDSLLLCDGCDKGYHLYCLTPPLEEIPEGDWYCYLCLPIIHEQYDPSLVLESDFEENRPVLNSHSDDESSINVVDSDSDGSRMEWRPARNCSPLLVVDDSSESSEDYDRSVNEDSNDNSSDDDDDAFHRRRPNSKVTISTSTEGSELESESSSDIDVVSIGESSSKSRVMSHSYSKRNAESEVESSSDSRSEEDESDLDEDVQPIGKRSKSSQRIESDSDSGENSNSGEPDDDPEDVRPIGNRLKRCKNSQRIESDSDSSGMHENSHSREPDTTTTIGESSKNKSSDVTWKNSTIPLTRLKWKIPRKSSITSPDFTNHGDTTDPSSTVDLHGTEVKKLKPEIEMKAEVRAVYSDVEVLDDITMTSLLPSTHSCRNTTSVNASQSFLPSRATQSSTESKQSQPKTKDMAGPSTSSHLSSDVHVAGCDDESKQSNTKLNIESQLQAEEMVGQSPASNASLSDTRGGDRRARSKKRRRSKRNRRKEQLADCPDSKKVETWFDFRSIETRVTVRKRNSSTRQTEVAQNGPYTCSASEPPRLIDTPVPDYNLYMYGQPMNTAHGILERPPLLLNPPYPPLLMNFTPSNYVSGQPPSYPPYHCPPPPTCRGPPQPQPLLTRSRSAMISNVLGQPPAQPLLSRNLESSGTCGDIPTFSSYHGPSVELQEPKKNPSKRRRRRKKKKTKLVLTVTKKSPKKSIEENVPVSKAVLTKRRRRSRRKKRKREEWKLKKRAAKEAGEWPLKKKRKKMFLPGSPKDPTYSPSKWDPKAVVQSEGCMTRARTAATNTPRRQAMREAVRESYRHDNQEEGLRFAREILAKQGRTLEVGSAHSNKPTTAAAAMENGMGNGNEYVTTPTRGGSENPSRSITPQSGYVEKSPRKVSSNGDQLRHPVSSIPETPPSTMSSRCGNRTQLVSDSNITGPSTSSYKSQEREQEYCIRIMDEVKRRTVPTRKTLSSVLVTPVQIKLEESKERDKLIKPVQDQTRGRAGSSDLINQLCQNLDDLQNRNNIIQRDGSIVPIKEENISSSLPIDPLSSLSSATPSTQMTSSVSPATTPQRHRSRDHHPAPAAYPTNQNHVKSTPATNGRRRIWMTPKKSRECHNSTPSYDGRVDSCNGDTNELDGPNLSSSPVAKSSQDRERRPRAAKRLLRSDSDQGRENGLPDYVTFVPDTPTTNSNSSPFFYSNSYPTTTATTWTTSMSSQSGGTSSNWQLESSISITRDGSSTLSRNSDTMSGNPSGTSWDTPSTRGGSSRKSDTVSSNPSGTSRNWDTSSISITKDVSSTLSRNSDTVNSDPSTDDPKRYVRRLLKQYYHLGSISAYQFWRILERASRRVEKANPSMSNCVHRQWIRKLVDDYVEAYISAAAHAE